MQFSRIEKKIILVLLVIGILVGGWFYYKKLQSPGNPGSPGGSTSGGYHKSFPKVLNVDALPSMAIRFYMLGADIGVISGRRETKDGMAFDEAIYVTSTSRDKLYDEYLEYFAGMKWTVTSKINIKDMTAITATQRDKQVRASFVDKGKIIEGRVSLLAPASTTSPSPSPSALPKPPLSPTSER